MSRKPVVVIGAGLAGLCCARQLVRNNVDVLLLEAESEVGGRVRTDLVEGFRLDRGFQVLQTAYPEASQQLDYSRLRLKNFEPGALILTQGKTVRMSDPWRRPQQLFSTAFNPIGNLLDRLRLARLRWHVSANSIEQLWAEPDSTTLEYLQTDCGFSTDMIERFLQPWFSGVFFERDLATSSRFFKFIFRMFALGDAALPEQGMGAITRQLAEEIPASALRLSTRVDAIEGLRVRLSTGEILDSRAVVLAVEGPEGSRLTNGLIPAPESRSTTTLYFGAPQPPITESLLVLNGDRTGPINNLCVPSNVSPAYAPAGQALVSASVIGSPTQTEIELEYEVRKQLRTWYGSTVDQWESLPSYHIRYALPAQPAHFRDAGIPQSQLADGVYHCGDYCESASIHGAMISGRRTAESILSAWSQS